MKAFRIGKKDLMADTSDSSLVTTLVLFLVLWNSKLPFVIPPSFFCSRFVAEVRMTGAGLPAWLDVACCCSPSMPAV
jgi:hypothetical protein